MVECYTMEIVPDSACNYRRPFNCMCTVNTIALHKHYRYTVNEAISLFMASINVLYLSDKRQVCTPTYSFVLRCGTHIHSIV